MLSNLNLCASSTPLLSPLFIKLVLSLNVCQAMFGALYKTFYLSLTSALWGTLLKKLLIRASLVAQLVKNLPAMWETWVWSLGWEYPLEKGKSTHSSILAWRIPCPWGHKESDRTEWLSPSLWRSRAVAVMVCGQGLVLCMWKSWVLNSGLLDATAYAFKD